MGMKFLSKLQKNKVKAAQAVPYMFPQSGKEKR